MAVKAGEADYRPRRRRREARRRRPARRRRLAEGRRRTCTSPSGRYGAVAAVDGRIGTETMPGVFAQIGMEYGTHQYGGAELRAVRPDQREEPRHSTLNPLAAYTKKMTLEEIMGDIMIAYPNTRPMCSANCDGAAAAVVVSDAKLKTLDPGPAAPGRQGLGRRSSPPTRGRRPARSSPTSTRSPATPPTRPTSRPASSPEDLDLVELHDCFATAELVHYDNLMLCAPGEAVPFFESGATWRDGKTPVNVSGGLESKGHPIAATGIANIWEVCHHLRGEAGDRQIEGAKVGLAHVIGLGSACGVHILEKSAA